MGWVRDTGTGVAPERFDDPASSHRFAGVRDADRRDGSGLGLAIVRAIAEAPPRPRRARLPPWASAPTFTLLHAPGAHADRRSPRPGPDAGADERRILIAEDDSRASSPSSRRACGPRDSPPPWSADGRRRSTSRHGGSSTCWSSTSGCPCSTASPCCSRLRQCKDRSRSSSSPPATRSRHGRRARRRRRRLHGQAVPVRGAAGPYPRCGCATTRTAEPTVLRHGDLCLDLHTRRVERRRTQSWTSRPGSSPSRSASCATPARCSPASSC